MQMISPVADSAYSKAVKARVGTLLFISGQEPVQKRNRISARLDIPTVVADMDAKKLPLVPLDPDIPKNPRYIQEFRSVFGLR
jgi:hypothetical protein